MNGWNKLHLIISMELMKFQICLKRESGTRIKGLFPKVIDCSLSNSSWSSSSLEIWSSPLLNFIVNALTTVLSRFSSLASVFCLIKFLVFYFRVPCYLSFVFLFSSIFSFFFSFTIFWRALTYFFLKFSSVKNFYFLSISS